MSAVKRQNRTAQHQEKGKKERGKKKEKDGNAGQAAGGSSGGPTRLRARSLPIMGRG